MSETTLCRDRLAKYCQGNGLDLGAGGDPIVNSAIIVDLSAPYASVGDHPRNLAGNASCLYWFTDECLDYVYSSHLLEDFPPEETLDIVLEWLRVLRVGGHLVLYLPDEQVYRAHCRKTGQDHNPSHSNPDFSLKWFEEFLLPSLPNVAVCHSAARVEAYSFELVIKKTGSTSTPASIVDRDAISLARERQLAALLAERDAQLASILNSISWRVTAPLRWVKKIITSFR
jgi:hypothetical protein